MTERALLVISGKILDRPFSLDVLDSLRTAIERNLADRGVTVTRRVATLGSDRQIAAFEFLSAGFEAVPADDEDMQAALTICSAVFSADPPDEVVFILGKRTPIEFLRSIGGRTRRNLLLLEDVDSCSADTLSLCVEGVLDVREILSKEGVNWNELNLSSWNEWVEQFDAKLSERAPKEECDDALALDALCETTELDASDPIVASAPDWNQALEQILLDNDLKCSAYKAVEVLDERFNGLENFYLHNREEFKKYLSTQIKLIEDGEQTTLCHVDHPDLRPVSAKDVVDKLSIGSASKSSNADMETRPRVISERSTTFKEVVMRVHLVRDLCEWSAERKRILSAGGVFKEEVEPTDRYFDERGRETKTFLWPKKQEFDLEQDDYRYIVDCYNELARAYVLMGRVAEKREFLDDDFVHRVMQLAANSQCLVKTVLNDYGIPTITDQAQRDAFNLLREFRETFYKSTFLYNMRQGDRVEYDTLSELLESCADLEDEMRERLDRSKGRRDCESKLSYHLGKIRDNKNAENLTDWQRVVEATTTLCEEYDEKPSSVLLRRLLADLIDDMPEDLEATDIFYRVVQSIELEKERDEREKELEWSSVIPDYREISPELATVRDFLNGDKVVFIGGTPQDHMRQRLEEKLNARVIWTETSHGDSLDRFGQYLKDPEVKLFLAYIPWCSHKHSEELATLTKEAGTPLVRLRKGTNPGTIAAAICKQLNLPVEG